MSILTQVLQELENTKFPKNTSRKNIGICEAFALGDVAYRGQQFLGGKTRGPSRFNKKFPKLHSLIEELAKEIEEKEFEYTTIQVNKNVISPPHVDKNNVGPSYIIALGDYTGGELVIKGEKHDIHNKFKKFDGNQGHWVEPFTGTRYSLVFFTHTFKPPNASLRNIRVTKEGLYKKDELIEKYKNGLKTEFR